MAARPAGHGAGKSAQGIAGVTQAPPATPHSDHLPTMPSPARGHGIGTSPDVVSVDRPWTDENRPIRRSTKHQATRNRGHDERHEGVGNRSEHRRSRAGLLAGPTG